MKRKVCVVVTARPSYSRIKTALAAIRSHPELELQLVVAASALLDRYGTAVRTIEDDGFDIAARVYMVLEGENLATMAKTTGLGLLELATVFDNLKPDVVVTVADRYETLATAVAASYMNIPVAHVQGGEVTGSIDEKVRHAVTKLADLHFVSTEKAAERVVRMGEEPAKVFVPEPLLAYAIEPKTKGDEDKLSTGLARLREEDPTLRVDRSEETHETVLYGMGDSHLEVAIARLRDKYGVEVVTRPARIPYKETIRRAVEATGRHVKQSGGHGQYAVCTIEVEPLPHGGGFDYVDKIVGGAIPHQFIPSVEKGIRKTMAEGVAAGYPMVDLRVTLVDGKAHSVDSSDMAFQVAGSLALKEAIASAGAVLLEPIVDLEVVVPEEFTGDVMGDLNGKRGKIQGMEQASAGKQRVKAQVPQAEVARYSIDLRSLTGGRGSFSMSFSHYEEVPQHLADRVIAEAAADREG
jgi:elongation factor G